MKRTIAAALLGMAAASSAMAQGHAQLSNYSAPYNTQITWGANTGKSGPVVGADGLQFQMYIGAGVVTDQNLLTPGVTFGISDAFTYLGGGWYAAVVQAFPSWTQAGDVVTVQVRTLDGVTPNGPIDTVLSRSALWQTTGLVSTAFPPPGNNSGQGLEVLAVIPEPTTFALAGLGAAALLIFRRRD
jgi:hypothetical protein